MNLVDMAPRKEEKFKSVGVSNTQQYMQGFFVDILGKNELCVFVEKCIARI